MSQAIISSICCEGDCVRKLTADEAILGLSPRLVLLRASMKRACRTERFRAMDVRNRAQAVPRALYSRMIDGQQLT